MRADKGKHFLVVLQAAKPCSVAGVRGDNKAPECQTLDCLQVDETSVSPGRCLHTHFLRFDLFAAHRCNLTNYKKAVYCCCACTKVALMCSQLEAHA